MIDILITAPGNVPTRPMSLRQSLRTALTDESLRLPILVGLATVLITVGQSWESVVTGPGTFDATISSGAIPLVGILVGVYAARRGVDAKRTGIWTGLAASPAEILIFGVGSIPAILATSWPLSAVTVVLALLTTAAGVGVVVFLTTVTAVGTDWVLTRLRHDHRVRRDDDGPDSDGEPLPSGSAWRLVLTCYAVAAPIVLLFALVVHPDGFPGSLLVALSIVLLFVLSLVTLPALFAALTRPGTSPTGSLLSGSTSAARSSPRHWSTASPQLERSTSRSATLSTGT